MPAIVKSLRKICSVCNSEQHIRTTKCLDCGSKITKTGKKYGQPVGTTAAAGYKVGRHVGRPKASTRLDGYSVGVSVSRPQGTTIAAGYNVGVSGGRPEGTTIAAGYNVGVSSGRSEGTTVAAGYNVGVSGGRPEATTIAAGCNASGGRPEGTLCINSPQTIPPSHSPRPGIWMLGPVSLVHLESVCQYYQHKPWLLRDVFSYHHRGPWTYANYSAPSLYILHQIYPSKSSLNYSLLSAPLFEPGIEQKVFFCCEVSVLAVDTPQSDGES